MENLNKIDYWGDEIIPKSCFDDIEKIILGEDFNCQDYFDFNYKEDSNNNNIYKDQENDLDLNLSENKQNTMYISKDIWQKVIEKKLKKQKKKLKSSKKVNKVSKNTIRI